MYISMMAYHIDRYDCPEIEVYWEILRADRDIVIYTVLDDSYYYGRNEYLPGKGLQFDSFCHFFYDCYFYFFITPTDLRYNGAQITGVFNLPECFNSSNVTDTVTLNIQGIRSTDTIVLPVNYFCYMKIMS